MYEYACKFSAVLETIWSSKTRKHFSDKYKRSSESVTLFWMTKWFPKRLKICRHTHTCIMNMPTNFQPFWKPFGHPNDEVRNFLLVVDSLTGENFYIYIYKMSHYDYVCSRYSFNGTKLCNFLIQPTLELPEGLSYEFEVSGKYLGLEMFFCFNLR